MTSPTKRQCETVADALRRRVLNASSRSKDRRIPSDGPRRLALSLPRLVERSRMVAESKASMREIRVALAVANHGQLAVTRLRKAKPAATRALKALQSIHRLPQAVTPWHKLAVGVTNRLLAEIEAASAIPKKRRGVPADEFRKALAVSLAAWWLEQGWWPTTTNSGAFAVTLRATLEALRQPSPDEFSHQMLLNAIGEAASSAVRGKAEQAELERLWGQGFDADAFLRRVVAGKAEEA